MGMLKRPTEAIEKLKQCAMRDACDETDCDYFSDPRNAGDVVLWIEYLENGIRKLKDILETE